MSTPHSPVTATESPDEPALSIVYPPDLPVSARRDEIARLIRDHQVVIVAGETGSGKTTQLPKICLELGRRSIAHTQPRRLAARTIAERVADELGVEVGGLVGYQVRFTDHSGPQTRVTLMTDGILLNRIHRDRLLRAYDTIILDEAHERSLTIDFLLGYLRRILPRRPDLKVIVTSATIDPVSFARHFTLHDEPAPIIEVSGRTFPVEIRYRPLVPEVPAGEEAGPEGVPAPAGGRAPRGPGAERDLNDGILDALDELAREKPGDVLVFLSGEAEIRDAADALHDRLAQTHDDHTEVLPLYGRLSAADQHRVFGRRPPGVRRRIVLATNVAETSLTVPGIRYVVDAGTARISRYSARAKVQRLPIEPISQASARQRSGRSGRTSDGIAIRLYSADDFAGRSPYTEPEIRRTNLASVILQMLSLGLGEIEKFPFLTPPDARGVKDGLGLLSELGAITPGGAITTTGRDLARLPIEPRFGRMVLEAERLGVAKPVRAIVAGLTVQDPRERPAERRAAADQAHARFVHRSSDFLTLLNLWNYLHDRRKELSSSAFRRLCKAEFLNYLRVREWQDVDRQIKRLTKSVRREDDHAEAENSRGRGKASTSAALKGGHQRETPDDGRPLSHRGASVGRTAELDTAPDGADAEAIHRALLAGLLSQIGLRDDRSRPTSSGRTGASRHPGRETKRTKNDYIGSRQIHFTLHPASALAKKPPAAVMTAELVETSRLFARMNASIDPAWAEPLAAGLLKHNYAEPHWEKRQGAAVAYETVTLYGVPIVTRRRVQFARIDAALARELFIRHALVAGEFEPHSGHLYDFLRANEDLRRELAGVEERTRRRDILYDDEAIVDFYDARLPPDVATVRGFEAWWRSARAQNPDRLTMHATDLTADTGAPAVDDDYPATWHQADQTLRLDYRFEPGSDLDGVSVEVPLPLLARLEPDGFDWQVPGMRTELITALLRSLPKAIRRYVVPAADWAARLAADLPSRPADGQTLTTALAAGIRRHAGIVVDPGDFALDRVPDHLRITFCAIDLHGAVAGYDKDLDALQRRLAGEARSSVARAVSSRSPGASGAARTSADQHGRATRSASAGQPVAGGMTQGRTVAGSRQAAAPAFRERAALTGWDFEELPRVSDTEMPAPDGGRNLIRAYPSLVVEGDAVAARLLSTPEERGRLFPTAVRRLLIGSIPSPASYVADHLTAAEKLSLAGGGYRDTSALFEDCLEAIADDVLRQTHPDGLLFTRREFDEVRDRLQAVVVDRMFETAALAARILTAARSVRQRLEETASLAWLAALTDIRSQVDGLVYPGFLSATGLTALPHLPRYLDAAAQRLTALPQDPSRDAARLHQYAQAAALYAEAGGRIPSAPDAPPWLVHERWSLEEFRVSLFAQQLGTAWPVSLKRIRKALAARP